MLCSLFMVRVSFLGSLPVPILWQFILISPEFIWKFRRMWKERVWEQWGKNVTKPHHTRPSTAASWWSNVTWAIRPWPSDHARFRCASFLRIPYLIHCLWNVSPRVTCKRSLASAPSLFIRKCSGLTWLPPSVTVDKNPTSQCLLFIVIEQNWWNSWRRLPFLLSSVWITNLKHSLWKLTGHSVVYHSRWRLRLLLFLYCISHNGDWTRVSSKREKQAC